MYYLKNEPDNFKYLTLLLVFIISNLKSVTNLKPIRGFKM